MRMGESALAPLCPGQMPMVSHKFIGGALVFRRLLFAGFIAGRPRSYFPEKVPWPIWVEVLTVRSPTFYPVRFIPRIGGQQHDLSSTPTPVFSHVVLHQPQ